MNLDRYRDLFVDEAREHLAGTTARLAAGPPFDRAAVDELFRHAHSIKGMAAAMGLDAVRDLAHAMEDRLQTARAGDPLTPPIVATLLAAADRLAAQVEAFATGTPLPAAEAAIAALRDGGSGEFPLRRPRPVRRGDRRRRGVSPRWGA